MTKRLIIYFIAFTLSACEFVPTPENQAKSTVRKMMIDPNGAQFGEVFQGIQKGSYCGWVNGKNRMGAYVGETPFFYEQIANTGIATIVPETATDRDFSMYYLSLEMSSDNYKEILEKCTVPRKWEQICGRRINSSPSRFCDLMNDPVELVKALRSEFKRW